MIQQLANDYMKAYGIIAEKWALEKELVGLEIFDSPIVGFARADDSIFSRFRDDLQITNRHFVPPEKWLGNAKSVVSIFFPYAKWIKEANAKSGKMPSSAWLHGRYEGQEMIDACTAHIVDNLQEQGYQAVAPSLDKRYAATVGTWLETQEELTNAYYYSNWSERHVAFACGLGSFGLSKGLITEKGTAGRFTSIITNCDYETTQRTRGQVFDYCKQCGACALKCPVRAIDTDLGKDHTKCSRFLDYTAERFSPRYGCGKCQVGVPCESNMPG